MAASKEQADAGTNVKRWLNRALFPVSAGAVTTEIVAVAAVSLDMERHIGIWAGLIAAAMALLFQIYTHKNH